MSNHDRDAQDAAASILARTTLRPRVALVLGSGLSHPLERATERESIPYQEIPGYPLPTVAGHAGVLVLGRWRGTEAVALSGRPHFYEGYSMQQVAFPTAMVAALGVRTLVVTNAAGGLNPDYRAGDLMLIADHINLPGLGGVNPLRGPHDPAHGPRFLALDEAYDPVLRSAALAAGGRLGISLHQGVYAMVAGPNYETPAERRMLRHLGADAVGMSTVPEVLAARQLGLRVLGISCITNAVADAEPPSHEEVLAVAQRSDARLADLLDELMPVL